MTARDARGRTYVAAALATAAAIVAIEALLVVPGHLLAAQIADAALVLLLVNAGPRRETQALTARAATALAALRALALVPLIGVVALGLPMRDWSEPVAVLALALPVGLVALRLMPSLVGSRSLFSLRPLPANLYAVCAGAVLGLVAYLAGAPALWPEGAPDDRVALGIAAAIVAACVEELVFRGLVQRALQRAAGRVGMLVAGAVFASTYLDAGSTALVLTVALAGVVFGHTVARTGALGGVIAGHVLLVVGAGAIWPAVVDESPLPQPQASIALAAAIVIAIAIACRKPAREGQPEPDELAADARRPGEESSATSAAALDDVPARGEVVTAAGAHLFGRAIETTAIAWLRGARGDRPELVNLRGGRELRDERQLAASLTAVPVEIVAIDAPLHMPHAVACADDDCPRCFPSDGSLPSIASRALESADTWKAFGHVGTGPMPVAVLAGVAFRAMYLARVLRRSGLDVVETWTMGVYRRILSLTGPVASPDGQDPWRRELLRRVVTGVDENCPAGDAGERDQLDAVAAAFAGWVVATNCHETVDGDRDDEGAIVIPGAKAVTSASD